jgi:hypothetical protein
MSSKLEFKKFIGTDGFVLTANRGEYAEANIYIGNTCVFVAQDNAAVLLEIAKACQEAYNILTSEDE